MDEKFNSIPVSVIHFDKDGTVTDVEDYNLDKVDPLCGRSKVWLQHCSLSFASSIRTKIMFEHLGRG